MAKLQRYGRQWVAFLFIASMLAGCAATTEQEYAACLTTVTGVGVGAGAAGGAGGAAIGGGAAGSLATYVLCQAPDTPAVESLEPPSLAGVGLRGGEMPLLDADADGIDDAADRCADTPSGVAVDAIGCPEAMVFDSRQLNFAFDSAALPDDADAILTAAAAYILEHKDARFKLTGHTDATGSAEYNQSLSLRRARAVRDALVARGVAAVRLNIEGVGATKPVASNETEVGRARNRRVELIME